MVTALFLRREAMKSSRVRFSRGFSRNFRRAWTLWRAYLAEELRELKARRDGARAAAADPVLALRSRVEEATLRGLHRYVPRRFAGRVALFLPGPEWLRSGVAAQRWHGLAQRTEEHLGPEASTGSDMLREAHAPAFAELFKRAALQAVGTRPTSV